jgi:hypothetical protein
MKRRQSVSGDSENCSIQQVYENVRFHFSIAAIFTWHCYNNPAL